MKKHIAIFSLSALLVCLCFSGCGAREPERSAARLADYRPVFLEGSSGGVSAAVYSGVREDPYSLDGECGEKKDYAVVTLSGYDGGVDGVKAELKTDGASYDVELSPHPFDDDLSAELPVRLDDGITSATLVVGAEEITLTGGAPVYGAGYALTLAKETVNDRGEIVLRLTRSPLSDDGGRYWYVSFTEGDETSSVLINAESGEVAAVRDPRAD